MPASDHRERLGARKICSARYLRDRLFTGIDQVRVFFALEWEGPDAKHAVLTLQDNLNAGGNVVRHQRRHADPEVNVEAISQLTGNALHDTLALLLVFLLLLLVRCWCGGHGRYPIQSTSRTWFAISKTFNTEERIEFANFEPSPTILCLLRSSELEGQ